MVEKLIVVGCGGIGSHFIKNMVDAIIQNQVKIKTIDIYDSDKIELKNQLYTTFECTPDQIGQHKASVIKTELDELLSFNSTKIKINAFNQIYTETDLQALFEARYTEGSTLLVSTVDGSKFRTALFNISVKVSKNSSFTDPKIRWIDMRSHGSEYLIFRNPTNKTEVELLEPYFVDKGIENASCQRAEDLARKIVKYGNRIVALYGLQYVVNIDQDITNRLIRSGGDNA